MVIMARVSGLTGVPQRKLIMYSTLAERMKERSINDRLVVSMDWMAGEALTLLSTVNILVMLIICTLMREKEVDLIV